MDDHKEEKTIDIPWLKKHFGSEKEDHEETGLDPDFVAMLEELEYR